MLLSEILHEDVFPAGFKERIEELLWKDYQEDPFLPAEFDYAAEMDDDDYLMYVDHVRDILRFAKMQRITDPALAIQRYAQAQEDAFRPHLMRH